MFGAPKKCAKCQKQVYSIEELKCLDKVWHKGCFKCSVCNTTLSLKNYKGVDKQPYCFVHYPQQKHTAVSDNPELLRIKENTKIQSNAKYHEDFEKSKGNYTVVADDPEMRRVLENTKLISNIKYHEDFEKNIKNKCTPIVDDQQTTRAIENQKNFSSLQYKDQHRNNSITNLAAPALTANNPISNTKLIATYRSGETKLAETSMQRRIGSIADYDPLIHEKIEYNANEDADSSFNKQYLAMQQQLIQQKQQIQKQMQHKEHLINGNDNEPQTNHSNPKSCWDGISHNTETKLKEIVNNNHDSINDQEPSYDDIQTSVYRAIYDYDAKEDDEISFRDGDKFINCELIDVGWMIGVHEKTGKHGMIPSNYAEPIDLF